MGKYNLVLFLLVYLTFHILRFIHVIKCINSLFLLLLSSTPQFVFPFTKWYVFHWFLVLSYMNKAVMKLMHKSLGGHILSFLLNNYLGVEWIYYMVGTV